MKKVPGFNVTYKIDFRQDVVNNWIRSVDNSLSFKDWGWKPSFKMDMIVDEMLTKIKSKI